MADDDAGERCALQHGFEPFDTGEIKVVRWLVEQEEIRRLRERGGDGEAFFPSAGERGGGGVEVGEARTTKRFGEPQGVFDVRHVGFAHRVFDDAADGNAVRELGDLRDSSHAGAFAKGDFTSVGTDVGGEDFEKRGFARAVRPDQADAIAVGNIEGDVLKERMEAISLRQRMSTEDRGQARRILLLVSLDRIPVAEGLDPTPLPCFL